VATYTNRIHETMPPFNRRQATRDCVYSYAHLTFSASVTLTLTRWPWYRIRSRYCKDAHRMWSFYRSRLSKVRARTGQTDRCDPTHYHAVFAGGKKFHLLGLTLGTWQKSSKVKITNKEKT